MSFSNSLLLQETVLLYYLMILLLKSGLLYVFTFTLLLFSPLPWPLFLRPLPLSGDGDEEHALLSHGVCQEWGDLRWVMFSSTRSVWPQYLNTHCPAQFIYVLPISVAQKILHCCVSNVFDKQGSIKVLLSLRCSYSNPGLNRKGHMIDGNLRTMQRYGHSHVLHVIALLNVLTSFSCCIKWHHWGPLKATERQPQREKEWFITLCVSESLVYCLDVKIMQDIKIIFYLLTNKGIIPPFSLTITWHLDYMQWTVSNKILFCFSL